MLILVLQHSSLHFLVDFVILILHCILDISNLERQTPFREA